MYDAIVVGARAAGAPTALLLARRGHRVLLVDRAAFPSDTLSTHYIHQPGVERLARWGLLEAVIASGCPPVHELVFDVGPLALRGAPPPAGPASAAFAPRRTVLDAILVEAAARAGAEVRTQFPVEGLVFDEGRVSGIRSRGVTERARVVVGADGRNSLVARAAAAGTTDERPARTCAYYSYWAGAAGTVAELYLRPGRTIISGPTNEGLQIVVAYWPRAELPAVRADVEGRFLDAVALAPALAGRLAAGERVERFQGTGSLPFYYRKPFGPGWALVGDAGYHKDPITAEGISDAFRDAELLAEALHAGLAGDVPLESSLAEYERARDEASRPIYELTHELAALAPPSAEQEALFASLRDDPERTSRFLGTIAGTFPVAEFFAAVPA